APGISAGPWPPEPPMITGLIMHELRDLHRPCHLVPLCYTTVIVTESSAWHKCKRGRRRPAMRPALRPALRTDVSSPAASSCSDILSSFALYFVDATSW
ncbi:MAG: hypothetical protein ACK55Z_03765, partial [bacterium]